KGAVRSHRISFPDWHERVDDIVAEGDRVVIRFTSTGTQLGEFQGIAPTGRKVSIQEVAIFRVVDSKIVEQWGMPDIQGLMQQLGATNSQRRGKISEHATLAEALDAWLCVDTDGLPVGDWPAMAIWKDGKWTAKYRSGRPYE
ncbi:hypothetical protein GC207_12045, partial [bacterium]|nr:hypothetical protein [bacterium]